jgi:fermentation-respiration switch protein FrsA (DUF1100 family)
MLFENQFLFFPERYPFGDWDPEGLAIEDAQFTAADGARLHGWFVPHPAPVATILFAHGNGGNLTFWGDDLRWLHHEVGAEVLIFDYRGFGRSLGSPNEAGAYADARAGRRWLAERTGKPEASIVLLGCSLGGAVMVELAASDGARGLVLQNTFTSVPDVARKHMPWLPVGLLRQRFDSLGKIRGYHGPLLQSHAMCDTIVPYGLGEQLFAQANEPKQFLSLAGADHNDPLPEFYWPVLRRFLEGVG